MQRSRARWAVHNNQVMVYQPPWSAEGFRAIAAQFAARTPDGEGSGPQPSTLGAASAPSSLSPLAAAAAAEAGKVPGARTPPAQ